MYTINFRYFIEPKQDEPIEWCQDSCDFSLTRFAISDGVTNSFMPRFWAQQLTHNFVSIDKGALNFEECARIKWNLLVKEFIEKTDNIYLENAYNDGMAAAATFVGLEILLSENKWNAQAIGDSFLIFVPMEYKNKQKIITLSTLKKEEGAFVFDNYPDYLSSDIHSQRGSYNYLKDQPLEEGTFYLMTDALAQWLFKNLYCRISTLEAIHTAEHFSKFILEYRSDQSLKDDDTTLFIINITKKDLIKPLKKETFFDKFIYNWFKK